MSGNSITGQRPTAEQLECMLGGATEKPTAEGVTPDSIVDAFEEMTTEQKQAIADCLATLDPPNTVIAVDDGPVTIPQGGIATVNLIANDMDPDGDTFSVTSKDDSTLPVGIVATDNGDGTCTYTVASDVPPGTYSHTYEITDANGNTDAATVTIIVEEVPEVISNFFLDGDGTETNNSGDIATQLGTPGYIGKTDGSGVLVGFIGAPPVNPNGLPVFANETACILDSDPGATQNPDGTWTRSDGTQVNVPVCFVESGGHGYLDPEYTIEQIYDPAVSGSEFIPIVSGTNPPANQGGVGQTVYEIPGSAGTTSHQITADWEVLTGSYRDNNVAGSIQPRFRGFPNADTVVPVLDVNMVTSVTETGAMLATPGGCEDQWLLIPHMRDYDNTAETLGNDIATVNGTVSDGIAQVDFLQNPTNPNQWDVQETPNGLLGPIYSSFGAQGPSDINYTLNVLGGAGNNAGDNVGHAVTYLVYQGVEFVSLCGEIMGGVLTDGSNLAEADFASVVAL